MGNILFAFRDYDFGDVLTKIMSLVQRGTISELDVLFSIVLCHFTGRRTFKSINIVLGALLYVCSFFDAIPDIIPIFGFIDDAAVVMFVVTSLQTEINEFKIWRNTQTNILPSNAEMVRESLAIVKDKTGDIMANARTFMNILQRNYRNE